MDMVFQPIKRRWLLKLRAAILLYIVNNLITDMIFQNVSVIIQYLIELIENDIIPPQYGAVLAGCFLGAIFSRKLE